MPDEQREAVLRTAFFAASLRAYYNQHQSWVIVSSVSEMVAVELYLASRLDLYPQILDSLSREFKKAVKDEALKEPDTKEELWGMFRFGSNFLPYTRIALEKVTPGERLNLERHASEALGHLDRSKQRSARVVIEGLQRTEQEIITAPTQ